MTPDDSKDATTAKFAAFRDTGDARIRDQLVEEHLPLARNLATRFLNRGIPYEDLVQVAALGLVHAVDRFDPGRESAFTTFATPTILGEIKRHFRDRAWDLRVPRRLQELHLELNAVIGRLSQQYGRSPTISELSAATRSSDEEVIEAIEAGRAYQASSLDGPTTPGSAATIERALLERDEFLEGAATRMAVRKVIEVLPPREQLIMELRFWERLSQDEIARRLGISQMHVSRLLTRSLNTVRERLDDPSLLS